MVVSLIGGRGCGKSTVGRALAERLKCVFVDSDAVVVQTAGRSIAEIFADDGEPRFRDYEADAIRSSLALSESLVLATGGGAVLRSETRERLRSAGPVVWLTAPPEVLAGRIVADSATESSRPSLTGRGAGEEVADLLRERSPLYAECATLTESTSDVSVEETVQSIVRRLGLEGGVGR